MFHGESWKHIYFGVKRSKVMVTTSVLVFRQSTVLPPYCTSTMLGFFLLWCPTAQTMQTTLGFLCVLSPCLLAAGFSLSWVLHSCEFRLLPVILCCVVRVSVRLPLGFPRHGDLWVPANMMLCRPCDCAGLQCVAQCTLDGCWYRAEILDIRRNDDDVEMSIIFVDYGSCDYICDVTKSVNICLHIWSSHRTILGSLFPMGFSSPCIRDVMEPAKIHIRRMWILCAKSVGCRCGLFFLKVKKTQQQISPSVGPKQVLNPSWVAAWHSGNIVGRIN